MAEASIPVDLTNPGQVFACLGFLEAADTLLDDANGGYDWTNERETNIRFCISAEGQENPFAAVLEFLASADIKTIVPKKWRPKKLPGSKNMYQGESNEQEESAAFPSHSPGTNSAMPVRLVGSRPEENIILSHWADGSSRHDFKLYSGNRSAFDISARMLKGKRKSSKKQNCGSLETKGLLQLWEEHQEELIMQPFDILTPIGGSFNFDPRGTWTPVAFGYSPDAQEHQIASSPVVEILAAWGLENARPKLLAGDRVRDRVRYRVWGDRLPPALARIAIAGRLEAVRYRQFSFDLDKAGKNKIVTFAQEE